MPDCDSVDAIRNAERRHVMNKVHRPRPRRLASGNRRLSLRAPAISLSERP